MSNLIHSILPDPCRPIMQVHPDMDINQCITIMVNHKIGALVVTDDDNLLGILSERDIVWALKTEQEKVLTSKAADIMCSNVVVLKPTDTIETAMAIMTETKRRHVLIAEAGKLIAVISIGDILFNLISNKAKVIEQLQEYIHS